MSAPARAEGRRREAFSGRNVFILAAIGSAVGLGNIWRFPYVAYSNGGGAFIIPYIVALITAGIPLLLLDYAIGHRHRGSAPLALKRLHPKAEWIGWWHVLICFVIGAYYSLILAWALRYTILSFTRGWGDDPGTFFMSEFTQSVAPEDAFLGFDFVPGVAIGVAIIWVVTIAILAFGAQKGIGRAAVVALPLLLVMFLILVIRALFLPGAAEGLNAFFTPDWGALTDASIWAAAYGQIFFSLSVAFGIMITYSSYLKKKEDLTGSGMVVGFANSSFEILAGIGVFAALGFMASATGAAIDEVAGGGIGLAFIAFPTIINEAPAGQLIGVLFFGSLVFAGFTSMISIIEVIIAAVQDKLDLARVPATLVVGIPMALLSLLLFPTTTGLNLLDVTDAFVNSFGIMGSALAMVIVLPAAVGALPTLRDHLYRRGTITFGTAWQLFVGGVAPVVLGYMLINELMTKLTEGYGGMPSQFVGIFGWGMAIALVVIAIIMTFVPWKNRVANAKYDSDGDVLPPPVLDRKMEPKLIARWEKDTGRDFAAAVEGTEK